ncbi:hypothetical protein EWM62_06745 [Mucilaginibacter terrigena]|uniref:Uncharacterized protein n=1 Tax=Mucilaginibacter terrigena TaxID=2492395 RepID=A0A4Q5LQA3_9SPHI|nr:hypothetical protein [Mucilaginibacter terrigena]RYU91631.1 hypothetical protein EWM62_06745 [Mucilaginibacter terrigena]
MKKLIITLTLFILAVNFAMAQAPATTSTPAKTQITTPAAPVNPPPAPKTPYILAVQARKLENRDSLFKTIRVDDLILLQLSNPKEFMDSRPTDATKLTLYADGIALKGITSDLFNSIRKDEFKTTDQVIWVTFRLKQDSSTKAAWDNLYKLADSWHSNKLHVHLSMAWDGMMPVKTSSENLAKTHVTIVYFKSGTFIAMSVLYLGLIILILYLAVRSDILKEEPGGAYSLSQTQLAYWTVLIIGGFLYSLMLTNIPSTLNYSILLLLGISITTNGTATYIDYFKRSKAGTTYTPKKPKGFFNDILGDGESMNMQRFQIFAWNIVLGGYYIIFTINNKTMPMIPDVLLTLAGISSLGYVASKPAEA